jgi:hypothetical protein
VPVVHDYATSKNTNMRVNHENPQKNRVLWPLSEDIINEYKKFVNTATNRDVFLGLQIKKRMGNINLRLRKREKKGFPHGRSLHH